MKHSDLAQRLAVCSWSLQPADPEDLVGKLKATGIHRVQLALDPLRGDSAKWGGVAEVFSAQGIQISSGMFGCVGEDYSTLESIRLTGGIAPNETWEQNWKNIQATAALGQALGLKLVTFHAGFLPHLKTDKHFTKMLRRLAEVADIFERAKIVLGLETGQETAPVLASLLNELNHPNVGVNFDPANMILYGKGNPIDALEMLGAWIRQVHMKDAVRANEPGTWGREVPAGKGEVDWPAFFGTLKNLKFTGPIVIEREAGTQRVEDIRTAKAVAESAFS
jgi:sugar phosphate isomerase/epimerase